MLGVSQPTKLAIFRIHTSTTHDLHIRDWCLYNRFVNHECAQLPQSAVHTIACLRSHDAAFRPSFQRPIVLSMSDIRSKSAKFLGDSIAAATGVQDTSSTAAQIEQAVFDKFGQSTSNDYRGDIRNIGLTLKKDNPQLAQDLVQGSVAPEQLVNMSSEVRSGSDAT